MTEEGKKRIAELTDRVGFADVITLTDKCSYYCFRGGDVLCSVLRQETPRLTNYHKDNNGIPFLVDLGPGESLRFNRVLAYFPEDKHFEEFHSLDAYEYCMSKIAQGEDRLMFLRDNVLYSRSGFKPDLNREILTESLRRGKLSLDTYLWIANKRKGKGSCVAVSYLGRQAKTQDDIDVIRGMLALGV